MTEAAPVEHIRRRRQTDRSRKIRARLVRGGAICLVGVVAFMAATMWKRSRDADNRVEQDLRESFLDPLKKEVKRVGGRLPLYLEGVQRRYYYPDADAMVALRRRQEPIILGYSSRLTSLFSSSAYFVVIFDPAAFHACREGPEDLATCLDRCLRVERLDEPTFCGRIEAQNRWLKQGAQ